jgi:hypothetical protein
MRSIIYSSRSRWGVIAFLGALGPISVVSSEAAVVSDTGSGPFYINVDAQTSGISLPNGQFTGSTLLDPLQVSFPAGTYTGTVLSNLIDPVDASYTGWTYNVNTPLVPTSLENFEAFNDDNGTPDTSSAVIDYRSSTTFLTQEQAYLDSVGHSFTFTLTAPTTLDFVIPDNDLSDNSGGVSLAITAVPEPVSASLVILGSAAMLGRRQKRSSK